MKNQVINILISGSDPNGIKILELSGWTGKVFIIPRNNLKDIKDRSEINQPAVYYLFGNDENSTFENVYIGESETFFSRLQNHDINKELWNKAIVFSGQLDKADVKYLENKSTLLARQVNRYHVLNKIQPQENKLSEYKKVSADDFFEKIQYIMSSLEYPLLQLPQSTADSNTYYLKVEDSVARGKLLDNGDFMVLKNSQARVRETESFVGGYAYAARREFLNAGTLMQSNDKSYIFTKDVIFNSPSASAATIAGRSINGWIAWKDEKGSTLDENVRK